RARCNGTGDADGGLAQCTRAAKRVLRVRGRRRRRFRRDVQPAAAGTNPDPAIALAYRGDCGRLSDHRDVVTESQAISIFDLPHQDAQRLARSGAPVYLTVNPVEYHGPHLSLHNDRLVSTGIVRDLHERLRARHDWPLLLGGDLEVGV